jgi:hypothetical protein
MGKKRLSMVLVFFSLGLIIHSEEQIPTYTAKQFYDLLYRGNETSRDLTRKINELEGKPLYMTGIVDDIIEFDKGNITIKFAPSKDFNEARGTGQFTGVTFYFYGTTLASDPSLLKQINNLKKGQRVKILGEFDNLAINIYIRNCTKIE